MIPIIYIYIRYGTRNHYSFVFGLYIICNTYRIIAILYVVIRLFISYCFFGDVVHVLWIFGIM